MTSGLGHLVFVIYFSNLDVNVDGMISEFADDTEVSGIGDSEESYPRLHQVIDQMES